MPKPGHPLREISEFDPEVLGRLRDELSVTTAEEFVGLWRNVPATVCKFVGGEQRAAQLASLASNALSGEELERISQAEKTAYPFRTGHDAPPSGKETF